LVGDRVAFGWAGAQFVPFAVPQRAANLSAKRSISFWARGDGHTYAIQLSAKTYGFVPVSKSFVADSVWRFYSFKLSDFDGMGGDDLAAVAFVAGPAPRRFLFQIDDVRFRE